jgi:hypothetical protein
MKAILLILFLSISSISFSQLSLVQEIDTDTGSLQVRLLYVDHGMPKILVYNQSGNHFDLYNTDYSLYRSVDIPEAFGSGQQYDIKHITRTLFDCDTTQIEYLVCGQLPNPYGLRQDSTQVGITEEDIDQQNFNIYPNPSDSQINIDYDLEGNKKGVLEIYNMEGQLIEQKSLGDFFDKVMLDVSEYTSGTYIVKIQTDNGEVLSERFIKVER